MQTSVRINDDPIGAGIRAGARLWLHWVGATTLGVVAAFAMFVVLYTIIGEPGDLLFPVLMAGVGLSFGAGQQRVLRKALGDASRWALATGLGLGLGIALALVIGEGAGLAARVEAGLVHGAAVGAIIGLLQWPILRPRVTGSRWWVPASILAWAVGAVAADTVGYFADGFDIMAGPIAAAAVSGVALAVLLRSPEPQPGAGAASATTPDRPRSDWPVRLRSRWLALNIVGFAVGGAIYGGLQRARMQPYYEVVTSGSEAARLVAVNTGTGLAIFGALLGGWQWLALRADLRASWWLPATCLGWAVGGAAAGAISGVAAGSVTTIGPDHGVWLFIPVAIAGCALIGLVPGALQWLILCRQAGRANRWPLASVAGLAMGFAVGFLVVRLALVDIVHVLRPEDFPSAKALVLVGAVIGTCYAVVTWPILAALRHEAAPPPPLTTARSE